MKSYEMLSDVLDIMWSNLMEAEKYIREAHDLKDECRMYADWCREMAERHIEFNANGRALFDRLRDMMSEQENIEHANAMAMIFDRQLAKLNRHCAEIKATLTMYK